MLIYNINNFDAFQFFCDHKSYSYSSIADQFITSFDFEQSNMNLFRLKFNDIHKERDLFTKTRAFILVILCVFSYSEEV